MLTAAGLCKVVHMSFIKEMSFLGELPEFNVPAFHYLQFRIQLSKEEEDGSSLFLILS